MFATSKLVTTFAYPYGRGTHNRAGDVAQLVEQRTENPCVGGSIPLITTGNPCQKWQGFFVLEAASVNLIPI